jgi:hypothetical protein
VSGKREAVSGQVVVFEEIGTGRLVQVIETFEAAEDVEGVGGLARRSRFKLEI